MFRDSENAVLILNVYKKFCPSSFLLSSMWESYVYISCDFTYDILKAPVYNIIPSLCVLLSLLVSLVKLCRIVGSYSLSLFYMMHFTVILGFFDDFLTLTVLNAFFAFIITVNMLFLVHSAARVMYDLISYCNFHLFLVSLSI